MNVYYTGGVAYDLRLRGILLLGQLGAIILETGLFGSGGVSNLVNILFFVMFFGFMLFGQQIQSRCRVVLGFADIPKHL